MDIALNEFLVDNFEFFLFTLDKLRINEIESDFIEDRRKHNDEAHDNGVSADGYLVLGGQAGPNDASLKLSRYQPDTSRDLIKIGLCNAATIKSKDLSFY